MLFELFGAITGCAKGKGGSMHMGNMDKGMVPAIAIVGGGIPLAAGMALAFKMKRTKQVSGVFLRRRRRGRRRISRRHQPGSYLAICRRCSSVKTTSTAPLLASTRS